MVPALPWSNSCLLTIWKYGRFSCCLKLSLIQSCLFPPIFTEGPHKPCTQCTMYIKLVQCKLYSLHRIQGTVCIVLLQCTLYLYSVHCTCTVYIVLVQWTLYLYSVHCTVFTGRSVLYSYLSTCVVTKILSFSNCRCSFPLLPCHF